jgi:hypothetical protein
VKLDEFEIREQRPRTCRERKPLTEATRRIGALEEQATDAARRDHHAAGVDHERTLRVHREHALDGIVLDDQASRLDALQQRDRRAAAHRCDQRAHDLAAGAVAGGVYDPVAAVRRLQAKPPAAIGPPVERHAKSGEMLDRRGGRVDDAARDGFIAQASACGERVSEMQGGIVIPAHRRGKSALRPQA